MEWKSAFTPGQMGVVPHGHGRQSWKRRNFLYGVELIAVAKCEIL
jgi:hypothetical protein